MTETQESNNYFQAFSFDGTGRHKLKACSSSNSIYSNAITITPLWKKKKDEAFALEQKKLAEIQLAEDRIKRGTAEPVDLGLSVKWASHNLGTTIMEQPGLYVGWGDITAQNISTNYNDYPTPNPPTRIDGTEFDLARRMWAETWRLPTNEEMLELMQQCQWMWTSINGVTGFQITGKTGNAIFLPAGGQRYGGQFELAYTNGSYWTGNLFEQEPARACYLSFTQFNGQLASLARYMGMCIRPVLGTK